MTISWATPINVSKKLMELDKLKAEAFYMFGERNVRRIVTACVNISQNFQLTPYEVFRAYLSTHRTFLKRQQRGMSTTEYITDCIKNHRPIM